MAVGHFDKKKKCRTIPLMLPVFSDTTIVLSIFFVLNKDGLSALHVLHALEEHASTFKIYVCAQVWNSLHPEHWIIFLKFNSVNKAP